MVGWWTAAGRRAVAVLLVAAVEAGAVTLRSVAADGQRGVTTVVLRVSPPATPAVDAVRGPAGDLLRLYVDLPPGSHLAPGVKRVVEGTGPVAGMRVGGREDGGVRVVLELHEARGYEVTTRDGRIAVAVRGRGDEGSAAAEATAPRRHSAARLERAKRPRIVLDPGHGGRDPGAQGFAVEKDVTLDVARGLARLLRQRLRAEVILTRTGDGTLTLADRTARANAEGADLFVSIHANANPTGRLQGVETYYLDNSADRATIRLAALENGLDQLHPGNETDLRYILSDLVQVGKMEESIGLANAIQRGIVRHLRRSYSGVVDLGVKRGPFYVLVGAYMPCVLVETAFLSHPVEGRRLATARYRAALAEGLYAGIARFLGDRSRARTL